MTDPEETGGWLSSCAEKEFETLVLLTQLGMIDGIELRALAPEPATPKHLWTHLQ